MASARRRVRAVSILIAALALWAGPANAEWAEWIADAEFSCATNSNINNAVFDFEALGERIWTPSVSLGRIYQLTDFTRLIATADISAGFHDKHTLLDYQKVGATFAARRKFGVGLYEPWARVSVSAASIDSRSSLRDGRQFAFDLSAGKRVHERVDVRLGYSYDERDGADMILASNNRSGSVYDLKGHSGSLFVNLLASQDILLTLGYSLRKGGAAATCGPQTIAWLGSSAEVWTLDDAIEGCAYRMDAATNTYMADASYSFMGGHASLNLGFQMMEGNSHGFSYRNEIWRASFNYSY